MSPGHSAPGGSAHATIPFRQLPAAAFPAAAYASGNCRFAATFARRRASPYQSGPPKSWHRPRTSFPGRRSPRWQKKQWCSPCPLLASPGLPGWLPTWGPPGWPMGTVTIGQPGGFVSAEPKTALRQPSRQADALGREHRNSPLNALRPRACWWRSPATRCPRGRQRAGSGAGPRQRRLPPAVPGAPLRLRHRPHRRPPVRPSANRSCQRHCPIGPLGVPTLAASGCRCRPRQNPVAVESPG
jgi:hypothetical protein